MDVSVPSTIRALFSSFEPVFSAPSFQNFVTMVSGWMLCNGRRTLTRVLLCGRGSARRKHFSTLYRFFSRATWDTDHLGHALCSLLLPLVGQRIVVIVDDTLCRRSGPHFWGAAMHHDPLTSSYRRGTVAGRLVRWAFGHNWVVLAIHVPLPWSPARGAAVPILWRLYRGKKGCPKATYRKKTELARELVDLVASWLPQDRELLVTADGEYACHTVVRCLPAGAHFTGPMLMDAALYDRPSAKPKGQRGPQPKKGARLPSPRDLAQDASVRWHTITPTMYGREVRVKIKTHMVLWYTVAYTRAVRMIVTRHPTGRLEDRAYFSTDLSLSVQDVLEDYAKRWSLEVTFRDAKQHLGLQDPQNGWWRRNKRNRRRTKKPGPQPKKSRGRAAIRHTAPLTFCVYGLVIVWYLRHGDPAQDVTRVRKLCRWYRHKKLPSFADMLDAMRREFHTASIPSYPLLTRVRQDTPKQLPHHAHAA